MTHHTDTQKIEADLERSRSKLGSTLDELQERVSVENLAKEALGMVRNNAAAYASSIDSAVRANPLALTLTGIGLAWLVFGNRKPTPSPRKTVINRWEDEGGRPAPAYADRSDDVEDAHPWADKIDALRAKASKRLREIEREARSQAGGLRDYAADRAAVLSKFTEDMRSSLMEELDGLSDAAKVRIVKAREAAYAARLRVGQTARAGTVEAERMVNEHPMVAGGIALALGAAFAAALPRTRVEDRTFGAESDRLMSAAAAELRTERARLKKIAAGVADELETAAKKTADDAADKASEIAGNLRDRAESEAKNPSTPRKPEKIS